MPGATVVAVDTLPSLYAIRISGRLDPTELSAFPAMVDQLKGGETELTGLLADRSALFGVLAVIEALGLELLEVRQIPRGRNSPESGSTPPQIIGDPPVTGPPRERLRKNATVLRAISSAGIPPRRSAQTPSAKPPAPPSGNKEAAPWPVGDHRPWSGQFEAM
jgi:hypothetical protein